MKLLAQACSHKCFWLGPGSAEDSGSGQLPQRSWTHAWACRSLCLLSTPSADAPAPVEFTASGFLRLRWLAQTLFHRCPWSGPVHAEDPGLVLFLQRSLAQAYFLGSPRLTPGPTEISVSSLLPQRSLPCTCFCGVHCLKPPLTKVAPSDLFL